MEHAAAHGVVQDRLPLLLRVRKDTDGLDVVEVVRLLLYNQPAQGPGRLPHRQGVDVDLRREADEQLLHERPIGHATLGLHKGVGQLPEVAEEGLVLQIPREGLHIVQGPPVQALHILPPLRNPLRVLLEVLAVEGRQGDQPIHAVLGERRRVRRVHQVLHLGQQPVQAADAAVVLDGVVGEGPPHRGLLPVGLRFLDAALVDDVDRLHDVGHILGRQDLFLAVGDAGGHVLVGHVDKPFPGQPRRLRLILLVLEDLEGPAHQGHLLPRGLEGPQGHVGPGAQDIPPGLIVLDLVVVLQVGRRLGEAQAHARHVGLRQLQLQPHQTAAQAVAPDAQPVQGADHPALVILLPGQTQKGPVDLAEQPCVLLLPDVQKLCGKGLQLLQRLPVRLEEVVQHREQLPSQQLHIPPHQRLRLLPIPVHPGLVVRKGQALRLLPGGEGGNPAQIGDVLLLIQLHTPSLPPAGLQLRPQNLLQPL